MPFVFAGIRRNEPLSDGAMLMLLRELRPGITTHGFRSTFRELIVDDLAQHCISKPNPVMSGTST